jgi:hypothetical protein
MKSPALFTPLLFVLSANIACAQLSAREQASFAEQCRRSMGLEATVAKIEAGQIDAKRLALIRAILSATQEHYIHNQRGATGNAVYLHPDGHQEAAYGPDGQLVSDGINDGSYNYFEPTTDALRHYLFDIHPWILWGNSPQDPTTVTERLSSYMADLDVGIVRASKAGSFPAVDIGNLRAGEPEAYAIFLNAVHEAAADDLFAGTENQEILDAEMRIALLTKIEKALQRRYAK